MIAKVLHKDLTTVTFRLKSNNKRFTMPIHRLSQEDQAYLESWAPGQNSPAPDKTNNLAEENIAGEDETSRLFPRSKEEIKNRILEIKRRPRPEGVSKKDWDAVTQLNIFRHLSGVPDEVTSDIKLNAHAHEAAAACAKHGGLSHSIGHYTNKCNLSGGGAVDDSPRRYILDRGNSNRDRRGHRRWCLNPPMGKAGFGSQGAYSAMWATDTSGSHSLDFWAYPGEGYYPEEYLLANSWSAYFNDKLPAAAEIEITIFKLSKRPEKMPISADDLPGKRVEVLHKSTYLNALNFEVAYPGKKRGIYWVQIKGRGIKHRYLVDLY